MSILRNRTLQYSALAAMILAPSAINAEEGLFDSKPFDPSKPIYEQASKLICKELKRVSCKLNDLRCQNKTGEALWSIDFSSRTVSYLNSKYKEKILAENHNYYDMTGASNNSILLSSNRSMHFELRKDSVGANAFLFGETRDESFSVMRFDCFPST